MPRDSEDVGRHGREPHERVFQQLLDALLVPRALLDEVKAEPGVVAQLADLLGRDEARPQHAMFGQVGEPDRIDLVGLRSARYRCHRPDDRQLVAEDVVDAFK